MSGVALVVTLLVASPSVAGVTVGSYVALGDSYASGQGLAPFVATTPASCDRSTMSYPYLLASSLGLDVAGTGFRDATCAGAQLGNLATSVDGAPAQLSAVTAGTDLVTLNAGGNDANFVTLAATCVQARAFAQFATLQQQRCGSTIATVERFLGVTTSARPVYASVLRARYLSALVTTMMGVLSAIRAAQGPFDSATGRATVLAVVNYPVIFPSIRAQAPACQVGVGLSYSARDAATLRAINVLLNQEIAQAANRYVTDHHDDHVVGVNVANALRPLSCHLAGGNSDLRAIDLAHLSYSLHPLASGQAKIANAIHASLMARAMLMRTGHALRRAPH